MQYPDIAPLNSIPTDKPQIYTYEADAQNLEIGQLVRIPLYKKQALGVVVRVHSSCPDHLSEAKLKPIIGPEPDFPVIDETRIRLAEWISQYYVAPLGLTFSRALPGIPKQTDAPSFPETGNTGENAGFEPFTRLLHTTADNRKAVYYTEIEKTLKKKRPALILVPESTLLEQTKDELAYTFPDKKLALLHGSQAKKAYWKNWILCLSRQADIILGTRQALMAPVKNLGLMIVEGEHSSSYKQWAMQPRYDARTAARKLAELAGAGLIFGSAAPTTSAYHSYQRMDHAQPPSQDLDPVRIVDMRNELKGGNFSIFSEALQNDIRDLLDRKRQAMLFVNRRASSRFILCRDCGYVIKCPNCDSSLAEYSSRVLLCQHCGYRANSPVQCPHCSSARIKGFGIGTEKVAEELRSLFPAATIDVLDLDHTKRKQDIPKIFQRFNTGQSDILIGTQMALGLRSDFLELTAAINIDSLLHLPDWQADEKALGLLSALAETHSHAQKLRTIIQTYSPENDVLAAVKSGDHSSFYDSRIRKRKRFHYPPFAEFVKLEYRHSNQALADQAARELKQQLYDTIPEPLKQKTEIIGPKQALVSRVKSEFVVQLVVKTKKDGLPDRSHIQARFDWLARLPAGWTLDVEPDNLL